jgi:AraC family transcriptional regulator
MQILDQVQQAIDFIERNLHEEVDLRAVSRAAGMGHSNFQRTFKALTGETLKRYVRARRLGHAMDLLESTDRRVLDVALAAGYESQESFARVFKSTVGVTPSEWRQGHRVRSVLKKARIDEAYLEHLGAGRLSTEPVLEFRDAIRCVGVATRFDGAARHKNSLGEDLPSLWERLLSQVSRISDIRPGPFYGVISDPTEGGEGLEYLAGAPSWMDPVPQDLCVMTVPAGRWAVFAHHGLVANIDHTVNYIYGSWLVRADVVHTDGPDLEIYGPEWRDASEESVMYYAVPVT